MLRLLTNFILGTLYFTKTGAITRIDAFLTTSHTLVACSKLLTRVLLPAIKRLVLFIKGEVIVFHKHHRAWRKRPQDVQFCSF